MDYQEIGRFELNEAEAKKWAIDGMILLLVSLPVFLLFPMFFGKGVKWVFRWHTIPLNIVLTAFLFLLHELIHGLTINLFGAKAHYTYGIKADLPYLATTTESYLSLNQYKVVALTPFLLISLAGVALIVHYPQTKLLFAVPLAIHTSGAVGDLHIVKLLRRYPKESLVKDDLTGFRIYLRSAPGGNTQTF